MEARAAAWGGRCCGRGACRPPPSTALNCLSPPQWGRVALCNPPKARWIRELWAPIPRPALSRGRSTSSSFVAESSPTQSVSSGPSALLCAGFAITRRCRPLVGPKYDQFPPGHTPVVAPNRSPTAPKPPNCWGPRQGGRARSLGARCALFCFETSTGLGGSDMGSHPPVRTGSISTVEVGCPATINDD
jgi:hypothetical protein